MSDTIRVVTVRRIVYQGPREWVEKTIARRLDGVTEMGPGKFVESEQVSAREEPAVEVSPDRNLYGHLNNCGITIHPQALLLIARENGDL